MVVDLDNTLALYHAIPYHIISYHTIPYQTKGISALELDRDMGFSRGHQGHRPPDDDDDKEEDDDVVEDNDEVEDNDKDDNNFKDISALGLDRDLGFSRGHQV